MMQLSAYGRLGQDPRAIETASGKPMTVCSMAVNLQVRDGDDATQWLDLLAFGRAAEALEKQSKGDLVSVSGRVQMNRYTPSNGETRETLQVVVDSLISARSVRPGGKRKAASAPPDNGEPFDDALPF